MGNAVWSPQPKQTAFLRRPEYEALYGGAAGGGKSEALVMEAVRQVRIPHYRALILRKTYPELSELIGKSLCYYPRAFPEAKFNETKHRWTFPSGAAVEFGAMHRTADKLKYQGRAWDFIAFDELTHFTWEEYSYLFSRNRPNGPGTRVYIRASANPGGVGHGWVKERFITAAPPGQRVLSELRVRQPDGKEQTVTRDRVFIPASVYDNKILLANDPNYIANLSLLPEAERRALLYGDWDSFSGQVFTEWRDDPAHYADRRWSHVIEPFAVPQGWPVYRGFDWGYSRPFSVGWWAIDREGCMYRVRELYGCTGEPNTGVRWTPGRLAREIREIERDDPNLAGRRILGVADPAIWDGSGGESIADIMEKAGVYFDKADHARISGKMQVHSRLAFGEDGRAMLYVFKTCRHFIRTMPALVYDQTRVEDVDTGGEDHIYDETRYVAMERKIKPRVPEKQGMGRFDPLEVTGYDEFAGFR
ncbi:Terminase-like family protein [Butyricicoccus sp. 1XD8-22]|nr:Terminase-like family protein [Butyricicoccus sp. 1XD8-22]